MESNGNKKATIIKILRFLDSMHDILDRNLHKKAPLNLISSPQTHSDVSKWIGIIFGEDESKIYITFCREILNLQEKQYDNINQMKNQMFKYFIKDTNYSFGKSRHPISYNTNIVSPMYNITPEMMFAELKASGNKAGYFTNASKYSMNTNMRLDINSTLLTFSQQQYLSFAQLLDPSTIPKTFKKYVFHFKTNGILTSNVMPSPEGKDKTLRWVLAPIYEFEELYNDFKYYYIFTKEYFDITNKGNNFVYYHNGKMNHDDYKGDSLVKGEKNNVMYFFTPEQFRALADKYAVPDKYISIVCFRFLRNNIEKKFLNIYALNTNLDSNTIKFLKTKYNDIMMQNYKKNKRSVDPEIYQIDSFTSSNKLSIEKLLEITSSKIENDKITNQDTIKKLLNIALDYKRSFDSIQMKYHADLNEITIPNSNHLSKDLKIITSSSIITHDILAGLFGLMYGSNLYLEYRGTYRHFSSNVTKSRAVNIKSTNKKIKAYLSNSRFLSGRMSEHFMKYLKQLPPNEIAPNKYENIANKLKKLRNMLMLNKKLKYNETTLQNLQGLYNQLATIESKHLKNYMNSSQITDRNSQYSRPVSRPTKSTMNGGPSDSQMSVNQHTVFFSVGSQSPGSNTKAAAQSPGSNTKAAAQSPGSIQESAVKPPVQAVQAVQETPEGISNRPPIYYTISKILNSISVNSRGKNDLNKVMKNYLNETDRQKLYKYFSNQVKLKLPDNINNQRVRANPQKKQKVEGAVERQRVEGAVERQRVEGAGRQLFK